MKNLKFTSQSYILNTKYIKIINIAKLEKLIQKKRK